MQLHTLDWIIAFLSVAICFVPALFFGKRSGKSTAEFFASGRSVPWWLAGISMVATTFSSDTPNLVANFVRTQGVAGNWQWWAFTLTGVSTVFFYARLWRRSGVLTDLEFYELRYSGKAASAVRGFRAVYLGLFFNCIIMATVNLAACKIAAILFGLERWQTLLAVGLLNVVFATHSGLWGVLVIDMIQFFIKMSAVIAAAYFAVTLPQVGGLSGLVAKLSAMQGPGGLNYLNMLPDFTNNWDLAVAVFIMPIAVQWWAIWYPGAEPGGGSYIAQRMLASKSEKDALGGTLFFNVAHYVLRPWPWILVGLASLIVYPELSDIQKAFPNLDPDPDRPRHRLPRDAALPAGRLDGTDARRPDRRQLLHHPHAPQLGRVLPGARFLPPLRQDRGHREALRDGRPLRHGAAVRRLVGHGVPARHRQGQLQPDAAGRRGHRPALSAALVLVAHHRVVRNRGHDQFLRRRHCLPDPLQERRGLRLLRSNCSSASRSPPSAGSPPPTSARRPMRRRCSGSTKRSGPSAPAGGTFRQIASVAEVEGDNIPLALIGWTMGCTMIWSALFTVGNFLYGRTTYALILGAIFAISGFIVIQVVRKLWK